MFERLKKLIQKTTKFNYISFWEDNYSSGDNSGPGSYGKLAEFKAKVINNLIKKYSIKTVIEFGVGDGNQLTLMNYENYLGLDVSKTAILNNIAKFSDDPKKSALSEKPLPGPAGGFS